MWPSGVGSVDMPGKKKWWLLSLWLPVVGGIGALILHSVAKEERTGDVRMTFTSENVSRVH